MKKVLTIIFSVGVVFFLVNHAAAQKKKAVSKKDTAKPVSVPKTSSQENFAGVVDGKVYKNLFFNFKLTIPETWIIQQTEVSEFIEKKGKESLKGKNTTSQQAINKAAQGVSILFTASKDILGIADNAVLIFATEKVGPIPQVRNGHDYLRLSIQSYKMMQLPPDMKYSEKVQSEKFGGETFYYIDVERAGGFFRHYSIYRNGYALLFTMQYVREEDLSALKKILEASDFAWKE